VHVPDVTVNVNLNIVFVLPVGVKEGLELLEGNPVTG